MACVPDSVSTWLSIAHDGTLSADVNNISVAGLTGMNQLGVVGGRCLVSATGPSGPVNATVTVLAPQTWSHFRYESDTVYSAIGQTSVPMKVMGSKEKLAPTRYSVACASHTTGTHFAYDTITGMATVNDHLAFTLDPASGTLHVTPTQALEDVMDGLDQGSRRKISLKCKVYGHYGEQQPDLQPLRAESQELSLELRDDICWVERTANFAGIHSSTSMSSLKDCLQACRDTPDCTDIYYDNSKCNIMSGLCLNNKCPITQQEVHTKVPNCGERTTCLNIIDHELGWISGEYCPMGEAADGPVFLKGGETVPDTLYLAKFDVARDGSDTGCLEGDYVLKQAMPGVDFEDADSNYIELKGDVVKCVGGLSGGRDLVDAVFSDGRHSSGGSMGTVSGSARRRSSALPDCMGNCSSDHDCAGTSVCGTNLHRKGGVPGCEGKAQKGVNYCYQPEQYDAEVAGLACGAPNTTMDTNDEEDSNEISVAMLVFDDPATDDIEADHWLHPCDCFPESWGPTLPVTQESYTAVPAGSKNMFTPGNVEIVAGSFVCEDSFLIDGKVYFEGVDLESEDGACSALCAEKGCAFFWEGQVADSKQCRLYSDCNILVREAGTEGMLMAKAQADKSFCRMADPATCWKVRGRRDFLGAAMPGTGALDCAYGDLLKQCDHKLLLGGFGVEKCGVCSFVEISDTSFLQKKPLPTAFDHGQRLGVGCWEERFRASAAFPSGAVKTQESLTCVSGTWLDSSGSPGLTNFACAACVQIVSPPYSQLDGRNRQELYFSSRMELTIKAPMKTERTLMRDGSLNGHLVSLGGNPSSKLLECQGDCDTDDDCAGGLMCFQRSGHTDIPGCKGDGTSGWDYCIAPYHFTLPVSTPGNWKPTMAECEGECISDATCDSGLKCWTSNSPVPGCSGDPNGKKYCYDPSKLKSVDESPGGSGKAPLFECQGDCDTDDECYGHLKCFQSNVATPYVPNCGGTASSGADYCYDPNFAGLKDYNQKGNPISNGVNCEGDCDSDSECASGYKCFQRSSTENAPGCTDKLPASGFDTCFDPNAPTSKTYQYLGGNLPLRKMIQCEGDCDTDDDCEGSLVCFQRDGSEAIPGCEGSASSSTDFCVEQTTKSLDDLGYDGTPWPSILAECQGDCDTDSHCDSGLKCFQRSGTEPIPGCEGAGKSTWDYCYDPRKADTNAGTPLDLDLIGFVAKTLASMPEELKLIQSSGDSSICMESDPDGGLASADCSNTPKEEEMLTIAMLPSLLKEEFMKPGVVPDGAVDESGKNLEDVSLDDFSIDADCGEFALNSFGFLEQPAHKLSMFATCGLSANIGEPIEHTAEIGGEVDVEFSTCTAEDSQTGGHIIYSINGDQQQTLGSKGRSKGDKDKNTIAYTGAFKSLRIKTDTSDGWLVCRFKLGGEDMPTASLSFNFPELPCFIDDNSVSNIHTASAGMGSSGTGCETKVLEVKGNRAIFELANARMECPEGQVLTGIKKHSDRFVYKCSAVSSLGSCSFGQSPQVDMSSGMLDGLRNLQVACPHGEILSALVAEESNGGKWLRYRYSCCATSGVPLAVVPSGRFIDDGVQAFEGIYCPVARDVSGRVSFDRVKNFGTNTDAMKLLYDRAKVKWCIEGGTERYCQNSDAAHPLEAGFEGTTWEAVALSDFDGEFQAKGASKPASSSVSRKKPELIKFGAARPEYKPECKDEVTPGEATFDLDTMNEEGMGYEDGNPCKNIAGKVIEEVKETALGPVITHEGEGASYWSTHGYDDSDTVWGAGTTYDQTRSCRDREITRDLKAAEWDNTHDSIENFFDWREGIMQLPCSFIPAQAAAAMGFGPSWDFGEICEKVMEEAESTLGFMNNKILIDNSMEMAIGDTADCNSIQHFLSRTFCDLHCLRDSVRAGDEAILKALEDAVTVIGQNTDLLMEHYAGTLQDSLDILLEPPDENLMQETARMTKGLKGMLVDMKNVVQGGLGGHSTVLRAMTNFKNRMATAGGSNVTAYLQKAAREAQTMHAMLRTSAKGRLDTSATVASQSAEEVAKMQHALQVRNHMLGVYRTSAEKAKKRQVLLGKSTFFEEDLVEEIRAASARTLLLDVDRSWWAMRDELDKWFDTAAGQAESYGQAFAQLEEYTSCRLDYSQLHSVYNHAMKAERLAQTQLHNTWQSVVQELGLLSAKIQDGEAFLQFGHLDMSGLSMAAIPGLNRTNLCDKSAAASSLVLAELHAPTSFVRQTWSQVQHVFKEMSMLRGRFLTSGLKEPSEKPVLGAWMRLANSYKAAMAQQEQLADEAVERLRREECQTTNLTEHLASKPSFH
eukprot:TRINITY_DN36495_c0_g1_i1.p1 TRINITY_DN36495_c0_g1~~TRINITY_DN36495_c0_g1_i1.p1  ORF type:complete len:2641 (-),score=486.46 TRINITY_DN36495_c0_g1_i1:92-6985(-)